MVKSYYKYDLEDTFGVIYSPNGNAIFDASGQYILTAALDRINVWNHKLGIRTNSCSIATSVNNSYEERLPEVTFVIKHPIDQELFAAGYSDGSVRLWNIKKEIILITFHGHTRAISSMNFDSSGAHLATGSLDTDIVIWDVIGEQGLSR
jgi:U3 small nucleolar RNA-associated protein 12